MKETTKGADFFHSTTVCVDAILAKTQRSVGVCPTSNKTQPPRHCVIKSRHLWASLNTLLSLLHAHQPYFFSSDKSSLFLLGPLHLAATSAQNTLLPGCSTCFNLSFMTQLIHHLLRDVFPGPLLMVHSLHNHQPLSLCSYAFLSCSHWTTLHYILKVLQFWFSHSVLKSTWIYFCAWCDA